MVQQGIPPETPGLQDCTPGLVLVKPTTFVFEMRNAPLPAGYGETYHGTRMDKKALNFHTQLHEWNEAQNIASVAHRHALTLTTSKEGDVYLPTKKMAQIEYWTKDVNKYYLPNRSIRPKTGSFMTIDVSKYNMKKENARDDRRVKSANYPSMSMSAGLGQGPQTVAQRRFFGTDFHTVRNNLVQSQLHYSAQRKDIYTRPRVQSGVPVEQDFPDDLLEIRSVSSISGTHTTGDTSTSSTKLTELEHQKLAHIDREVMQPRIVARSSSNRMLNVISIDDCKLTCRYRPQTIKEKIGLMDSRAKKHDHGTAYTQEYKEQTETVEPKVLTNGDTENEVKEIGVNGKENGHIGVNGHEADDEGASSEDNVPLKVDFNLNRGKTDTKEVEANGDTATGTVGERGVNTAEVNVGVANVDIAANGENTEKMDSNAKVKLKVIPGKDKSPCDASNINGMLNFSSRGTSRTSYGRITDLAASSASSNAHMKDMKKKKQSRTSQINQAITKLVTDRTVLKPMERDFDTKTAEFGRTVVDKSDGSDNFKRIHSKLRKQMDSFVDTHSALKTMEFYEKRRKNSATSSTR